MSPIALVCIVSLGIALVNAKPEAVRVVQVEIGEHCAPGGAPGADGKWKTVDGDEKVCAPTTSCRRGACNCDDLPDGSVTSIDNELDKDGKRVCKKISGMKCSSDDECFSKVPCKDRKCFCDKNEDPYCVDKKREITILA